MTLIKMFMNKNVQKRKAHKNFFNIFSLYGLNNQRILRYAHGASPVHTLRESQGLSDLQIHSVELQVSVSGSAMCSLKVILSYPGDIDYISCPAMKISCLRLLFTCQSARFKSLRRGFYHPRE